MIPLKHEVLILFQILCEFRFDNFNSYWKLTTCFFSTDHNFITFFLQGGVGASVAMVISLSRQDGVNFDSELKFGGERTRDLTAEGLDLLI